MTRWMPVLGRSLLAILFIAQGVRKFPDLAGTAGAIERVGLPGAEILAPLAAAIEFVGGLALLINLKPRSVAVLMALYMIPVTLLFHTDFGAPGQVSLFLKNLAIIGGLLLIASRSE